MALTCRLRKAERWTLLAVAAVFLVGTFYLAFSPDPPADVGEKRSPEIAGTSPMLVCDDASWGRHRMAVIVPFRDRFDELLEFAPYLYRFLCTQRVRHQIFIINQGDPFRYVVCHRSAVIFCSALNSTAENFLFFKEKIK